MCLPKGRRSPCYPVRYECFRQWTSCGRARHGCVFQRVEGVHVIQFSTNVLDSELPVNVRDMGVSSKGSKESMLSSSVRMF